MEREKYNPLNPEKPAGDADGRSEQSSGKPKSKSRRTANDLGHFLARRPQADDKPERQRAERSDVPADEEVSEPGSVETEEQSETTEQEPIDPTLEEVSEDEERTLTAHYVEARLDELAAEQQPLDQDDPESRAITAAQAFLRHLREALRTDREDVARTEPERPAPAEHAVDRAYDVTAAEIDPRPPEAIPINPVGQVRDFLHDQAVRLGANERPERPSTSLPAVEATEPQATTVGYHETVSRGHGGRVLLVAGVGYLIGRRRGRIKTEKRLKAVERKLESKVATIQERVEQREWQIRALARERSLAGAPVRVEARPSHYPAGHAQRHETVRQPAISKVDSLDRRQLIEASGNVRFGETNLKRVYEAQLVDETGLRRLMHEAEAGHDLRRALAREFLVKELRFERDPRLKGNSPDGGQVTGGGTAVADDTARPTADAVGSPATASPQTPATAAPTTPVRRSGRQTNVSPAVLILLTLFTLALAIYAIWLTITR